MRQSGTCRLQGHQGQQRWLFPLPCQVLSLYSSYFPERCVILLTFPIRKSFSFCFLLTALCQCELEQIMLCGRKIKREKALINVKIFQGKGKLWDSRWKLSMSVTVWFMPWFHNPSLIWDFESAGHRFVWWGWFFNCHPGSNSGSSKNILSSVNLAAKQVYKSSLDVDTRFLQSDTKFFSE